MTEYRHPLAVNFARASELTSLSKQTLRRLAKSGALKTILVTKRRRVIPYTALAELLRGSSSERSQ
jgi:predicted site-specific integrase-resolvase